MMSANQLRLGLMLDSLEVPAWLFYSLEQISVSGQANFALILLKGEGGQRTPDRFLKKLWRDRAFWAYKIFNAVDEKLFIRGQDASERKSLQKMMAGVPVISITPVDSSGVDHIQPEDLTAIRGYDLDLIIQIGSQTLDEEISTAAKYGIWYFEHSDERMTRSGPPGYWEVVESSPVTGVTLWSKNRLSPAGWAVYRSRILTYPFSPARTRNTSLWLSSTFLPRQIALLNQFGQQRFLQATAKYNNGSSGANHRVYQVPANGNAVTAYTRLLIRDLDEAYQRRSRLESWYLMFDFSGSTELSFANFQKLTPPEDRFWADPHVIKKDEKYYIFVEEYLYQRHKGHISVIEMDADGRCADSVPVLETNYHLSYPFVFEWENQYYMVPESAQNRSIDLYECTSFPNRWQFKLRLMENVIAKDTTLFFQDGQWWLFTGITQNEHAAPEVELFLFHSGTLFSTKWKSHPLNPVLSDVTSARPAGRIFTRDGKIYRPSQDCSKNYGSGFNINEVICLTESDYQEKKIAAVKPDWDRQLVGTHTYTSVDGLTMIDGVTRRKKRFPF